MRGNSFTLSLIVASKHRKGRRSLELSRMARCPILVRLVGSFDSGCAQARRLEMGGDGHDHQLTTHRCPCSRPGTRCRILTRARPLAAVVALVLASTCGADGEWLLAPTDLDRQNPDPSKRPDIVNNSWGGPPATRSSSTSFERGGPRGWCRCSRPETPVRSAGRAARRVTTSRPSRSGPRPSTI